MSVYVIQALGEAMIELMKTEAIEKITIDALTAKAGIGRATYFRNFNAKDEILTAYIVWQWREYEKTHRLKEHRIDAPYRVEQYFAFCQSMKKTNDVIFVQQRQGAILNAYEIIFRDYDLEEQQDNLQYAFHAFQCIAGQIPVVFYNCIDQDV